MAIPRSGGLDYGEEDLVDYDHAATKNGGYNPLNTHTQCGAIRTVWMDDWKLDLDMRGRGGLYNLAEDPMELRNLYDCEEYRDRELRMLRELSLWMIRTQDAMPPIPCSIVLDYKLFVGRFPERRILSGAAAGVAGVARVAECHPRSPFGK